MNHIPKNNSFKRLKIVENRFSDQSFSAARVIYKEFGVPIMMIEHTIFARSNTILSDQNACLLSYSIMEKDSV